MREFDKETIKCIALFEKLTNGSVRDCIVGDGDVYFLVNPGEMGLAIGKNGNSIKKVERTLNKNVKVLEYDEKVKNFVENLIPEINEVKIKNDKVLAKVSKEDKGKVIGKGGSNIKKIRVLLKRNSGLDGLYLV